MHSDCCGQLGHPFAHARQHARRHDSTHARHAPTALVGKTRTGLVEFIESCVEQTHLNIRTHDHGTWPVKSRWIADNSTLVDAVVPPCAPSGFPGVFDAILGVQSYVFRKAVLSADRHSKRANNYGNDMIDACRESDMKPVCDHPQYCRNDVQALYIGQKSSISYRPYRNINRWFPSGWVAIKTNWDGLCSYTGYAWSRCNLPINTHSWRKPSQYNPGFICGLACEAWPTAPAGCVAMGWGTHADTMLYAVPCNGVKLPFVCQSNDATPGDSY